MAVSREQRDLPKILFAAIAKKENHGVSVVRRYERSVDREFDNFFKDLRVSKERLMPLSKGTDSVWSFDLKLAHLWTG